MAECVDITAGRPTLLSAGLFENFVGNNPTAGQSKNKHDVRIYSPPYDIVPDATLHVRVIGCKDCSSEDC